MATENINAAVQRDPLQLLDELKKFCWILATALALTIAAIGYLLATSGLLERNMTNVVVISDFESLQKQVSALESDIESLKKQVSTVESATGRLDGLALDGQKTLSDLSEKVNTGNIVRTYSNGAAIHIGQFSNGTFLQMTGPGAKSSLKWMFDSDDNPKFWMIDKDGNSRLNMGPSRAGKFCFFALMSGANLAQQAICD